jgi:DNA-binding XRE family transcriptional regulator
MKEGLTQVQLADSVNLSSTAIAMLERGERRPSWDTVLALCRVLNVKCTAFTEAEAAEPPPPRHKPHRRRPPKPRG